MNWPDAITASVGIVCLAWILVTLMKMAARW